MVFIVSSKRLARHNNVSVIAAYIGVVLIWSTTPLAIAWSGQVAGFMFGVSSRMVIGVVLAIAFTLLLGAGLVWHRRAVQTYLCAGIGLYCSMTAVYWAAQYIPSGWIALLFGLTPIFSALMASWWLEGEPITRNRMIGMLIALLGLSLVVNSSLAWHESAIYGVLGVVLSGLLYSLSAVGVKRVNADIPATTMNAGSLLVATPLFCLTWWMTQPGVATTWLLMQHASWHSLLSIAYLALFGSVFGFSLYYFVLQRLDATRTALISFMTPITAMMLGVYLNSEIITQDIVLGALFVLAGLAWFEFGHRFNQKDEN